jgi:4-hydroxy-tetrahydrodipicolinate synthase
MDQSIFQGLSAFPLTPASADGRVDVEALGRLLERLVGAGVNSIGLLGSTGIYAYLEPSERRRAVAAAVEAVAGRTPLIVGVGTLRTDGTIDLARDAEARGADGLLLAPVSYTPPTPAEVFGHYAAVADATGLPICIYNNPTTTHVVLAEDLLGRLSRLASVAAVKMPLPRDGDVEGDLARLLAATAEGFRIGYSADWGTAPALLAGADAFYSGIAGILPEPMVALAGAARRGDAQEAARLDAAFQPLWSLCQAHGGLRVSYAISALLDLGAGEPPRPLLPLSSEVVDEVASALSGLPYGRAA